jgi:hypothetical protein
MGIRQAALMSKVVRKVWLASAVLLLCASGSCYVGEWQDRKATEQLEKWMEASGFYISHAYPETNVWEIIGFSLLCAGLSVAFAAVLLRRRDVE